MRLKKIPFIFILLMCFAKTVVVFAQQPALDQKKLEEKRLELKEEIKKIKMFIDNTQKKEASLSTQVQDLTYKMQVRQKLINTIDKEADQITYQINKKTKEVNNFQKELADLKKDYANMIYKSYKNRNEDNQLLFLFSAESFYQGYLRFQYFKQYTQYRKKQADLIVDKTVLLNVLIDSLNVKKVRKEKLMDDKIVEQGIMEEEKSKQLELVKKYQKQKKEYIAQVNKKQAEEKQLTNQIENLIREAIKKSSNNTSTTNKNDNTSKSTANKNEFVLAPEDKELAVQFSANQGNLPWPVEKGLVTVRFGKQPDPMDPKLTIESSGVRITTAENQKARSIFDGKVMAIQKNPQNGILSVLVQHGNYISVYSNLESISVNKGYEVKIKQNIGTIHTDKVTGKTILKFQIWKDDQKLDPSIWINGM